MTKRKKLSAIVLALAMLVAALGAFAGCNKESGTSADEKYPAYASGKHMWIGGWDVPLNTLEDYQMAKDMGLTHMFMDSAFAARDTEEYFDQLRYCEQVGLKAILGHDTATNNVAGSQMSDYDYTQFAAVDMINLWDEPYGTNFNEVAERVDKAKEIYKTNPDVTLYVNLSPNHEMFSGDHSNDIEGYLTAIESTVLDKIEGRRIYSTDIYPLVTRGGVNAVATSWLHTMSIYAQHAKKNNGEFHMFIQNYGDKGTTRDITSKADLTFQINTDMAFGIDGFSYFTYRQSLLGFTGGCVENNVSCTPKDAYWWAKEINGELAAWDEVYMSSDWQGVKPVLGSVNLEEDPDYFNLAFNGIVDPLTEWQCANAIIATQDTLAGEFKDADGNYALMLSNYTEPTDQLKDEVSITFKKANRALVYKNGKRTVYEVKKNKVNIKLAAGEGAFVIPLNV